MSNSQLARQHKPLCFVIGPISQPGTETRKASDFLLHGLIRPVLEAEEFGYRVKRADEDADPGMIGDRVVIDILNADLVIADLSELNPNAFYELGIRHAAEKPVIHIARKGTHLPFDNAGHRTIFIDIADWHNIEEGRRSLAESARAINTPDFKVSNPITQANARVQLRASADPRDQVISDLQDKLAAISARFENMFDSNNWSGRQIRRFNPEQEPILIDMSEYLGVRHASTFIDTVAIQTVNEFLDAIFFVIRDYKPDFEPFTYGTAWLLQDERGRKFTKIGTKAQGRKDNRSLLDVGIFPGSVLTVIPVSNPSVG